MQPEVHFRFILDPAFTAIFLFAFRRSLLLPSAINLKVPLFSCLYFSQTWIWVLRNISWFLHWQSRCSSGLCWSHYRQFFSTMERWCWIIECKCLGTNRHDLFFIPWTTPSNNFLTSISAEVMLSSLLVSCGNKLYGEFKSPFPVYAFELLQYSPSCYTIQRSWFFSHNSIV